MAALLLREVDRSDPGEPSTIDCSEVRFDCIRVTLNDVAGEVEEAQVVPVRVWCSFAALKFRGLTMLVRLGFGYRRHLILTDFSSPHNGVLLAF